MEAKHMEIDPDIKAQWEAFLEFIYTTHQLTRELWMPNYYSIMLWEEFKRSKKERKVIYIAGKYRGTSEREVFDNIIHARSVALKLWDEGWAAICPHTNTMFMGSRLGGDEKFIEGDLEILSKCDAIYMLNNWQSSKGAKIELERAEQLGLEIYYEET